MSYTDIWTSANDADFQGRCWAALWDVANKVAIEAAGFPASGQESTDDGYDVAYAYRLLRDESTLTSRQLAQQVLRNGTIASSPVTATDGDIQYQINNTWAMLRNIG